MNKNIDLRVIKTHEKLRGALAQMMTEIPFDQITINELCTKAKIRRATFYKHFKDKYDFLSTVISAIQDEISEKVLPLIEYENPASYYVLYVKEVLHYLEEKQQMSNLILSSSGFFNILSVIMNGTMSTLLRDLNRDRENGIKLPAGLESSAIFINGGLANMVVNWLQNQYCTEEDFLEEVENIISELL